jgi:hypothetical protein
MLTEMIVDVARRQVRATGAALMAAKPEDPDDADFAVFVEEAIRIFLDTCLSVRRTIDRVWELQRAGRVSDLLAAWATGSRLFDETIRTADDVRGLLHLAQRRGRVIGRAAELEQVAAQLPSQREEFRTTFPLATEEEAREARAAIARGEYLDADEAFARIAGVDVETWRRRVAEYEARKKK